MASGAFTLDSDLVTNYVAAPQVKNTSKLFKGKSSRIVSTIELVGSTTTNAGGILRMIPVQIGDVVTGGRVHWDALGSSTGITIGDSGDTDRFMTTAPTVSASANGIVGLAGAGTGFFNTIASGYYEYTAASYISVYLNDNAHTGTVTVIVDLNYQ